MALLMLCFGKCGIQFGIDFYTKLYEDNHCSDCGVPSEQNAEYKKASEDTYFVEKSPGYLEARCLMIDVDDSTTKKIRKSSKGFSHEEQGWGMDSEQAVTINCDGINNWSYGYKTKGPEKYGSLLVKIQLELNKGANNNIGTVMAVIGTSCNTASGIGSFVVEMLKREFPTTTLFTAVLLPFESDEVITQNYNTSFTLSKIYDPSDGVFLFDDHVVDNTDPNTAAVLKLLSIMQPILDGNQNMVVDHSVFKSLLSPNRMCKMLMIHTVPKQIKNPSTYDTPVHWEVIYKETRRTLSGVSEMPVPNGSKVSSFSSGNSSDQDDRPAYRSLGNVVIYRGEKPGKKLDMSTVHVFPEWVASERHAIDRYQPRYYRKTPKLLSVVSNNSLVIEPVRGIISSAVKAFNHKAYVHHYIRHDCTLEEFKDTFAKLNSIVKAYNELHQ